MDPSLMNQIVVATATLGASLGGYLLAGLNEGRRDKRTFSHEQQQRISERADQREDNTRILQRETLLALQDALQVMARLTVKAMHFDHMQARGGKETLLPATLSEDMLTSTVEVRRLASRILDPKVRDTVDEFIKLSTDLTTLPTHFKELSGNDLEDQASLLLNKFSDRATATMAAIGRVIRQEISWQPNNSSS